MSLFDTIRLPKWQHKNPEVRIQAIGELDDETILVDLVCNDPEPSVQLAALSRIKQAKVLDDLIEKKLSPAVQSQAKLQRLQQLLPQPAGLKSVSDQATLLQIIHLSEELELVTAAIDRIDDEETRLELATAHPIAKARLHAAQGIDNIKALGQLMQKSKGHDKAVFRHCKDVLDEVHAREKREAEQQEKISRLMVRITELAKSADSPVFEAQYRVTVNEWGNLDGVTTPEQKALFQQHQAVCGQRLIELREERLDTEQSLAAVAAANEAFPAILQDIEAFESSASTPGDPAALQQFSEALDELENRWSDANKVSSAPADLASVFKKKIQAWRGVSNTLQKLFKNGDRLDRLLNDVQKLDSKNYAALEKHIKELKKFLATVPWPESVALSAPESIGRLGESIQALEKQLDALDQDQKKFSTRLQELIESLGTALDKEQPKEADRALAKARKLLISMAPKNKQVFDHQLGPLNARLNEFHDWQNFAIEPKKEDLCTRMSALIGSTDDVELLALNIQTLQTEWKQLGPLPQAREKELWLKFKAAADEAWQPCKEAFSLQAKTRRENFARRMKLVEQLKDYEAKMDWPDVSPEPSQDAASEPGPAPDWKVVQKTLDTARAAFRSMAPVDAKAERSSYKAFREVCDRIYSHIHAEYQRNIARKEELVAQAAALSEQDDLPQAIETAKKLQADWKATGMTPVAVDRKLWKEFRKACDAVFARLGQQREEQKQETQAQVEQAEALRDQARALVKEADSDNMAALGRTVSELKAEMTAIDLPVPVRQRLFKDFDAMERQARDLAKSARQAEEQQSWTNLAEALIAAAENKSGSALDDAEKDALNAMPKGIEVDSIIEFLQKGPAEDADDSCREACIALEVFGEIESPAEDKKARMAYQLSRLTQGLGNQVLERDQALLDLINAFIALRPTASWVERFFASLEKVRQAM